MSDTFSKEISDRLQQLLPAEALKFVYLFGEYAQLLDDIIDEEEFRNAERQMKLQYLALQLYSSDFYNTHRGMLYPTLLQIHNTYNDSLCWEGSAEEWKRTFSDVLRCCGNEMIFSLVHAYAGYDAMREISLKIREDSYKRQH